MTTVVHISDSGRSSAPCAMTRAALGEGHSPSQGSSSIGSSSSPVTWSKPDGTAKETDNIMPRFLDDGIDDSVDIVAVTVEREAPPPSLRAAITPHSEALSRTPRQDDATSGRAECLDVSEKQLPTPVVARRYRLSRETNKLYKALSDTQPRGDGEENKNGGDASGAGAGAEDRESRRSAGETWGTFLDTPCGASEDHQTSTVWRGGEGEGGGGGGGGGGGTAREDSDDKPQPETLTSSHPHHHATAAGRHRWSADTPEHVHRHGDDEDGVGGGAYGAMPLSAERLATRRGHSSPSAEAATDAVALAARETRAYANNTGGVATREVEALAHVPDHTLDPPVVTASDYGDRQRLLYHVTYLSTQLQRAQLQLQEQQRTLTILHGAAVHGRGGARGGGRRSTTQAGEQDEEDGETVLVPVARSGATAAVLAARDEAELLEAFEASLALFDPAIAQTQINRLDSALAQVSLLREAELHQLRQAEHQLDRVRRERNLFSQEASVLRARAEKAEADADALRRDVNTAQQELAVLRVEDTRLSRQLAELRGLANDDPFALKAVRLHTHARASEEREAGAMLTASSSSVRAAKTLEVEEATARQALLQDMFWEPLYMAMDAGITWLSSSDVHAESQTPRQAQQQQQQTGAMVACCDVDLMLLRQQQDELAELRGQLEHVTHRLRVESLERSRWRELYLAEQRRSEAQASDFLDQLRHAYDQVQQDREVILEQVRREMEQEARQAFADGRLYEQRLAAQSSAMSPSRRGAHTVASSWRQAERRADGRSSDSDNGARLDSQQPQRRPPQRRGASPYSASSSPSSRARKL